MDRSTLFSQMSLELEEKLQKRRNILNSHDIYHSPLPLPNSECDIVSSPVPGNVHEPVQVSSVRKRYHSNYIATPAPVKPVEIVVNSAADLNCSSELHPNKFQSSDLYGSTQAVRRNDSVEDCTPHSRHSPISNLFSMLAELNIKVKERSPRISHEETDDCELVSNKNDYTFQNRSERTDGQVSIYGNPSTEHTQKETVDTKEPTGGAEVQGSVIRKVLENQNDPDFCHVTNTDINVSSMSGNTKSSCEKLQELNSNVGTIPRMFKTRRKAIRKTTDTVSSPVPGNVHEPVQVSPVEILFNSATDLNCSSELHPNKFQNSDLYGSTQAVRRNDSVEDCTPHSRHSPISNLFTMLAELNIKVKERSPRISHEDTDDCELVSNKNDHMSQTLLEKTDGQMSIAGNPTTEDTQKETIHKTEPTAGAEVEGPVITKVLQNHTDPDTCHVTHADINVSSMSGNTKGSREKLQELTSNIGTIQRMFKKRRKPSRKTTDCNFTLQQQIEQKVDVEIDKKTKEPRKRNFSIFPIKTAKNSEHHLSLSDSEEKVDKPWNNFLDIILRRPKKKLANLDVAAKMGQSMDDGKQLLGDTPEQQFITTEEEPSAAIRIPEEALNKLQRKQLSQRRSRRDRRRRMESRFPTVHFIAGDSGAVPSDRSEKLATESNKNKEFQAETSLVITKQTDEEMKPLFPPRPDLQNSNPCSLISHKILKSEYDLPPPPRIFKQGAMQSEITLSSSDESQLLSKEGTPSFPDVKSTYKLQRWNSSSLYQIDSSDRERDFEAHNLIDKETSSPTFSKKEEESPPPLPPRRIVESSNPGPLLPPKGLKLPESTLPPKNLPQTVSQSKTALSSCDRSQSFSTGRKHSFPDISYYNLNPKSAHNERPPKLPPKTRKLSLCPLPESQENNFQHFPSILPEKGRMSHRPISGIHDMPSPRVDRKLESLFEQQSLSYVVEETSPSKECFASIETCLIETEELLEIAPPLPPKTRVGPRSEPQCPEQYDSPRRHESSDYDNDYDFIVPRSELPTITDEMRRELGLQNRKL